MNRLNLERLTRVSRREAEPEIRELINHMIEAEAQTTPLSLFERENLIVDVLDELFGLGPLETLLKDRDISDILVNRHDQVYIERNGVLEETGIVFKDDRHLMQIIERIVSSVGRRIDTKSEAARRRAPDRRQPSQRDHPTTRGERPLPDDSAVSNETSGRPEDLVRLGFADAGDARLPPGRILAAEHHRGGRHRNRQDHAAQLPVELRIR